jgi:2,2-dialkylglycine decarboxylase (pyruvate)
MLLILDEAQTGFGRLGTMFGFELYDVVPDILSVSKTLGGGIPIAATFTSSAIESNCYDKGFIHVTSHVSDPLPAAVGLAVINVIEEEDLVERTQQRGEYLMAGLRELQNRYEQIGDVRGKGLLVGIELVEDRVTKKPADFLGVAVSEECLRRGLSMNIVRSTGGMLNCFRMAPPLSITEDEIDTALGIIDESLTAALAARAAQLNL